MWAAKVTIVHFYLRQLIKIHHSARPIRNFLYICILSCCGLCLQLNELVDLLHQTAKYEPLQASDQQLLTLLESMPGVCTCVCAYEPSRLQGTSVVVAPLRIDAHFALQSAMVGVFS